MAHLTVMKSIVVWSLVHTRDMQWHVACFWNRRHVAYELYSNTWWMEHLIIVVGGADSTKVMIRFQIIAPSIVNSAAKPPKIGQRLTMNGLTWPDTSSQASDDACSHHRRWIIIWWRRNTRHCRQWEQGRQSKDKRSTLSYITLLLYRSTATHSSQPLSIRWFLAIYFM